MKKLLIFLCLLGAASVPSAFAQATTATEQPAATPTPAAPQSVTLFTTSSSLLDARGQNLGAIEAVVVDPSGRIEYALAPIANPAYRAVVTPIPWQLLQQSSDAAAISGGTPGKFQQFTVPVTREALLRAPRMNLAASAGTDSRTWMAASQQYFGTLASVGAIGGVATASGAQTGRAASTAVVAPTAATAPYSNLGGSGAFSPYGNGTGNAYAGTLSDYLTMGTNLLGTNFLPSVFGTNLAATDLTNQLTSTNLFTTLSNFFATNLVSLSNRANTNFAGNVTNPYALGRTNPFTASNFAAFRTNLPQRLGTNFPGRAFMQGPIPRFNPDSGRPATGTQPVTPETATTPTQIVPTAPATGPAVPRPPAVPQDGFTQGPSRTTPGDASGTGTPSTTDTGANGGSNTGTGAAGSGTGTGTGTGGAGTGAGSPIGTGVPAGSSTGGARPSTGGGATGGAGR